MKLAACLPALALALVLLLARPAMSLPPRFVECLKVCADRCASLSTAPRCFALVKRCAKRGQQATCLAPGPGGTTTTTTPTATTTSTTSTTLLVPNSYQGQWTMTYAEYDFGDGQRRPYDGTYRDPSCEPDTGATYYYAPYENGQAPRPVFVYESSMQFSSLCSAPNGNSYGCYRDAFGTYEGAGIFEPIATASNPTFDETVQYSIHFLSSLQATITVVRVRDYHFKQCVIRWYGELYR